MHRKELEAFLNFFEDHVDVDDERRLYREWVDFAHGRFSGDIFNPRRAAKAEAYPIPRLWINDALEDYDLMAYREFAGCYRTLTDGNGQMMTVRANYGTSIVMSLFGVRIAYMDRELDTLPTSWPFTDWRETVKALLHKGVPSLDGGLCRHVFEMGAYFLEILSRYPNIKEAVHVCHPDFQGPMDICEVLIGSELFYALYDDAALIQEFLALITETYIALMKKWLSLFPYNGDHTAHWNVLHRGCVMLRDDSAMNLSPDMFRTFILPYDARILSALGGGAVHFCGRGDHYIGELTAQYPMLYGINSSQPHLNDVETLLTHTVDRGIPLLDFDGNTALAHLEAGRDFSGLMHVTRL